MAMPACCMAFAAYWARAGAVGGVHGAGVQVAGPALAWVEAIRAPTCTELETETTSRMYSDISMIPNRTSASSGVSKAASTAAAPRWSRGFLTAASLSHLSERWQRKQARVRRSGRKAGRWRSFYLHHGFFPLSAEAHPRQRPARSRPVEALFGSSRGGLVSMSCAVELYQNGYAPDSPDLGFSTRSRGVSTGGTTKRRGSGMMRFRRRRDQHGAAAVEFALVLLPILYLVFGLIQYGWYFYAMQSGSSAVGDAARRIAVGNCQTVAEGQKLLKDNLGAATTASTPSGIATTITYTATDGSSMAAPGQIGGSVTVTASFPTLNMHFPLIPVPDNATVTRTNVARIEDLDSSQGTCS